MERKRGVVVAFWDEEVIGRRTVTTIPDGENERTEKRNFIGRLADEIHRKRPETVYVAGKSALIRELNMRMQYETYSLGRTVEDIAAAVQKQESNEALHVVEKQPEDKIGGRHSSLIGDRKGRRAVYTVAGYRHVKKVIPGPIDGSGGSRDGFSARISRVDSTGNLRLILNDGSSVQTVRVVTTASCYDEGLRVKDRVQERLQND